MNTLKSDQSQTTVQSQTNVAELGSFSHREQRLVRLSVRMRAVWCCLWFGLVPWRFYERRCHYAGMSYRAHLWLNLQMASLWITGKETPDDWEFERRINPSWSRVIRNMFRPLADVLAPAENTGLNGIGPGA